RERSESKLPSLLAALLLLRGGATQFDAIMLVEGRAISSQDLHEALHQGGEGGALRQIDRAGPFVVGHAQFRSREEKHRTLGLFYVPSQGFRRRKVEGARAPQRRFQQGNVLFLHEAGSHSGALAKALEQPLELSVATLRRRSHARSAKEASPR